VKAKTKKQAWFRKLRGSYLPASWQGLAVYLVYTAYLVALPLLWYLNGHDLWRLLTTVVPLAVAALLVAQFVASKHAR